MKYSTVYAENLVMHVIVLCVPIVGTDDLVMGNKFVGFRTIISKLCEGV